ncbi:MAG TPA: SGNH/GDSL hydrolase family protein [Microbacterium sp.]|nr:SGNH/GDSL hydrolase family protein [Microbacterium sp.]
MNVPEAPPTTARGASGRVRRFWPLAGAALAIAAVCAVAALRPWIDAPGAVVASDQDAAPAMIAPAALALPEQARVLVFGDSWTYGSAASLPTLGYAYVLGQRLGWETTVDGVRGSGYLKPGLDGGSYGERIAALDPALDPDLVIVEGSINDRRLPAAGYRDAVTAAWDALAGLYPDADFVILGPAPQVLPVQETTARIDADLADLSAARGWWYISPIAEEWIGPDNYAQVIDTGIGRDHPSTNGHAYLATRVAEALAMMSESTVVVADAPRDPGPSGP